MMYIHLIFDAVHVYLGEIITRGGVFDHASLVPGSTRLETSIDTWRASGIPVRFEALGIPDAPKDIVFGTECVRLGDRRFCVALHQWAYDHKHLVVTIDEERVDAWTMMSRLPLQPRERFALALALSKATRPQLEKWNEALEEGMRMHLASEQRIEEQIKKKQSAAVKSLIKQYA